MNQGQSSRQPRNRSPQRRPYDESSNVANYQQPQRRTQYDQDSTVSTQQSETYAYQRPTTLAMEYGQQPSYGYNGFAAPASSAMYIQPTPAMVFQPVPQPIYQQQYQQPRHRQKL